MDPCHALKFHRHPPRGFDAVSIPSFWRQHSGPTSDTQWNSISRKLRWSNNEVIPWTPTAKTYIPWLNPWPFMVPQNTSELLMSLENLRHCLIMKIGWQLFEWIYLQILQSKIVYDAHEPRTLNLNGRIAEFSKIEPAIPRRTEHFWKRLHAHKINWLIRFASEITAPRERHSNTLSEKERRRARNHSPFLS